MLEFIGIVRDSLVRNLELNQIPDLQHLFRWNKGCWEHGMTQIHGLAIQYNPIKSALERYGLELDPPDLVACETQREKTLSEKLKASLPLSVQEKIGTLKLSRCAAHQDFVKLGNVVSCLVENMTPQELERLVASVKEK